MPDSSKHATHWVLSVYMLLCKNKIWFVSVSGVCVLEKCVSILLADVLSSQYFGTCFTFKTAQVPLMLQSQQSLTVLNIPATASTILNTHRKKQKNLIKYCEILFKQINLSFTSQHMEMAHLGTIQIY